MGNNLTVVNKYQNDQKFTVKVEGNVRIKNFKGNRKMQNHETMTVAKNGQVSTYYKWSNAKEATKESALNLNATKFGIFNKLRKADKADKNGNKLTRSDLEALRKDKNLQKQMGITIKYDPQEKVYGIYNQKEKTTLYFDYD